MVTPEQRSRELAEKATPGPWHGVEDVGGHSHIRGYYWRIDASDHTSFLAQIVSDNNAAFIAFHDPSYIKAMADVVEAARLISAEARVGLEPGMEPSWFTPAEQAVEDALSALDALVKERG